jgi:hypothetical protein
MPILPEQIINIARRRLEHNALIGVVNAHGTKSWDNRVVDIFVVDPRRLGIGAELAHELDYPALLPGRNPSKGGEEVFGDGKLEGRGHGYPTWGASCSLEVMQYHLFSINNQRQAGVLSIAVSPVHCYCSVYGPRKRSPSK